MRPTDIRLAGSVDLSGLGAPPPAAPAGGGEPGAHVVTVTEATFQAEVLDRSRQVPVIVDFWATWCGPCKQLSPVLERLAAAGGGSWVLATVDVDANQRLAGAFGVQSIPSVFAVIAGQPVPLFQGALPEAQVRQYVDEVLRVAAANGVTGADADDAAAPAPPPEDPAYAAAQEALQRGDLDGALAAYREAAERDPADPDAKLGVARLELLVRAREIDESDVRRRAEADPGDVQAQLGLADVEMAAGRIEEAIDRLVELVRRSAGDDRDRARAHLLALFDVLTPEDPRLAAGRRSLANALF